MKESVLNCTTHQATRPFITLSVPETGLCEGGERFQIEGSFPEHELTPLRLASGQV